MHQKMRMPAVRHVLVLFCAVAMTFVVLTGCASKSTPEGTVEAFLKAYVNEDAEALQAISPQGEKLVKEKNRFVGNLGYDDASTKLVQEKMNAIELDVMETNESEQSAVVKAKVRYQGVPEIARNDAFKTLVAYQGKYKAASNSFEKIKDKNENIDIHLKKKEEAWTIDLEDENNKELVNALLAGFIGGADKLFSIEEITTENPSLIFPDNQIHFLDGNQKYSYNVNPRMENGMLIPYYNQLRNENFIGGWNDQDKILTAIKTNAILEVPFEEYSFAGQKLLWPNVKEETKNEYTRENINVSENAYCNIDIQGTKSVKGDMMPLVYKENAAYMTAGLLVRNAGENIEQPLRMLIDGIEIGQTRKGEWEEYFDTMLPEDMGNPSEYFSLSDEQAKEFQTIGRHLVEIIQINNEYHVVYYQAIPYEVKKY